MMMKRVYFLLLLFIVQPVFAQEIQHSYNFRIRPGTENWKLLKTHKDMVEVCQIPEDTLKGLTTKALLETCLSYPLMMDAFAWNGLQKGFDETYKRFNGYHELVSRVDFANALIQYYKSLDMARVNSMPILVNKGDFSIKVSIAELFFITPEFINVISKVNAKELVGALLDKLASKNNYINIYGSLGSLTSVYAIANIMAGSDKNNEVLKKEELNLFKTQMLLMDSKVLDDIISIAKTFVL